MVTVIYMMTDLSVKKINTKLGFIRKMNHIC